MSKSIQVRVSKNFANFVMSKQKDYSKITRKPLTFVQATEILCNDYKKDNLNSKVIFYKNRGKRVLL